MTTSNVVNDAKTEKTNVIPPIVAYLTIPNEDTATIIVRHDEKIPIVTELASMIIPLHSSLYTTVNPAPLFFNK